MRAVFTPTQPHMPLVVVCAVLAVMTIVFWLIGIRSFFKRAYS
jgi:hypothetical protein